MDDLLCVTLAHGTSTNVNHKKYYGKNIDVIKKCIVQDVYINLLQKSEDNVEDFYEFDSGVVDVSNYLDNVELPKHYKKCLKLWMEYFTNSLVNIEPYPEIIKNNKNFRTYEDDSFILIACDLSYNGPNGPNGPNGDEKYSFYYTEKDLQLKKAEMVIVGEKYIDEDLLKYYCKSDEIPVNWQDDSSESSEYEDTFYPEKGYGDFDEDELTSFGLNK